MNGVAAAAAATDANAPLVEEQEHLDDNDAGHGDLQDSEVGLGIVVNNEVLAMMTHIKTYCVRVTERPLHSSMSLSFAPVTVILP